MIGFKSHVSEIKRMVYHLKLFKSHILLIYEIFQVYLII